MQQVQGYYWHSTGYRKFVPAQNDIELEVDFDVSRQNELPSTLNHGSWENPAPSKDQTNILIGERWIALPNGSNWRYLIKNEIIYYSHKAIAVVDFDTYCVPKVLEVRLIIN